MQGDLRNRVSVQAYYEYDQRGVLPLAKKSSCDFFCEVPQAWPEERERLYELLFDACVMELRVLCERMNAREPIPETHRITIKSFIVKDMMFIEVQAQPWRFTSPPFPQLGIGFPKYSCLNEATGRLSAISPDDFQERVEEDLRLLRASLPPVQNDELLARNIKAKCFLYYGDCLITDTEYGTAWMDEDGSSGGHTC